MITSKKEEAYYLYWIHRKCHTDINNEGYVGITFNPKKRFRQHKVNANLKMSNHISNAINKYDDIEYSIVCTGKMEYICDLENKLRPELNIGWNIAIGGETPISPTPSKETQIRVAENRAIYSKQIAHDILIDYYKNGLTKSKLKDKYGIHPNSILNIVLGRNLAYPELEQLRLSIKDSRPFRSRQWATLPEWLYDDILSDRESGKTFKELNQKYNIPIRTLRDYCKGELEYLKSFSCYRALPLRKKKTLTYNNKVQTIAEWSEETGIKMQTLWKRINSGWSVERILTTPVGCPNNIDEWKGN